MTSLADAFASAHLDTDPLERDAEEATQRLRVIAEQWEQILSTTAAIGVDTGAATQEITRASARWQEQLDNLVVTVTANTSEATGELGAFNSFVETISDATVTVTVDADTAAATASIETAAAGWEATATAPLVATVDMDTAAATGSLAAAAAEWQALADTVTVAPQFDGSHVTATLESHIAAWETIGRFDIDVGFDTTAADAELLATAARWRTLLSVDPTIDRQRLEAEIRRTGARLRGAAAEYRRILDLTATVGVDTTAAGTELAAFAARWETDLDVSATVTADTAAATADLLGFAGDLDFVDGQTATVTVNADVTGAAGQLQQLRALADLLDGQTVNVDVNIDTQGVAGDAATVESTIDALTAQPAAIDLRLNTAGIVAELEAISELLDSICAGCTIEIDVDLGSSIAELEALKTAIAAACADQTITVTVDQRNAVNPIDDLTERVGRLADETRIDLAVTADTAAAAPDVAAAAAGWRRTLDDAANTTAGFDVPESVFRDVLGLETLLGTIPDDVSTTFTGDTEAVVAQIVGLRTLAEELNQKTIDIAATVDANRQSIAVAAGLIDGGIPDDLTVTAGIDMAGLRARLTEATSEFAAERAAWETLAQVQAEFGVDSDEATAEMEAWHVRAERLANIKADIEVTIADAVAKLGAVETLVDALDGRDATINVDADSDDMQRLLGSLAGIDTELGELIDAAQAFSTSLGDLQRQSRNIEFHPRVRGVPEALASLETLAAAVASDPDTGGVAPSVTSNLLRDKAAVEAAVRSRKLAEIDREFKRFNTSSTGHILNQLGGARTREDLDALSRTLRRLGFREAATEAKQFADRLRDIESGSSGRKLNPFEKLRQSATNFRVTLGDMRADFEALRDASGGILDDVAAGGRHSVDVDVDTAGAAVKVGVFDRFMERLIGHQSVDVDADVGAATAKVVGFSGFVRRVLNGSGSGNVVTNTFRAVTSTVTSLASTMAQNVGGSLSAIGNTGSAVFGALTGQIKAAQDAGGALSFSFGSLGQGLAQAGGQVALVGGKIVLVIAAIAAGLPLIVGGIAALASAAGGILTLAAGFGTLAVSLGGAAAAAGVLGIALNKDIAAGLMGNLEALKAAVGAATRDVGEQFAAALQPLFGALANVARTAADLAPMFQPVLDSVLRFVNMFNGLLGSDAAARFIGRISDTVTGIIDMFTGALPQYLDLLDRIGGGANAVLDTVKALLDVGLQSGDLWLSIGNLMSSIARLMSDIAPVALPMVTKLVDTLTAITDSDPFRNIVQGGIEAWNGLLDIIMRVGAGIESVGIAGAMATVGAAFRSLADSGFGERLGEMFAVVLTAGAEAVDMLAQFLGSDVFADIMGFAGALLPVLVDVFAAFGQGFSDGMGGGEAFSATLKSILVLVRAIVPVVRILGTALGVVQTVAHAVFAGILTALVAVGAGIAAAVGAAVLGAVEVAKKAGELWDLITPGEGSSRLTDWANETSDSVRGWMNEGVDSTKSFIASIWDAGETVGEFGATTNDTFDLLGSGMDSAASAARGFSDTLGIGADALATVGNAGELSAAQIGTAGDAAVAAAAKFKNTIELIDTMRTKYSQPLELELDFSAAELDLASLIQFTEESVDPETGEVTPAKLVKGIGDAIAEAETKAQAEIDKRNFLAGLRLNGLDDLAAHVENVEGPAVAAIIAEIGDFAGEGARRMEERIDAASKRMLAATNPIQEAVTAAKKNLLLEARQIEIVSELETGGFSELAAHFASLDPADLEAAIETYATMAPDTLVALEAELDAIAAAGVEMAKRSDPLGKIYQAAASTPGAKAGILGQLQLTPDQIAAATGTAFDLPDVRSAVEAWLADMGTDLEGPQLTAAVDAILAGVKRGNVGVLDKYAKGVHPKQVRKFANDLAMALANPAGTPEQQQIAAELDKVEALVNSGGTGPAAQRWRDVIAGNAENVNNLEAQVAGLLEARRIARLGGTVGPDGTVSPGAAAAGQQGAAETAAFAAGITSNPTVVQNAANQMVMVSVDAITKAIDEAVGDVASVSGRFTNAVVTGINTELEYVKPLFAVIGYQIVDTFMTGMVSPTALSAIDTGMAKVAAAMVVSFVDNVEITVAFYGPTLGTYGSNLVAAVITGVDTAADTTVWNSAARVVLVMVGALEASADLVRPQLDTIGKSMTQAVADGTSAGAGTQAGIEIGQAITTGIQVGMFLAFPKLLATAVTIASTVAAVMRSALDIKSPSRVTHEIGFQVAMGLSDGIAAGQAQAVTAAERMSAAVTAAATPAALTVPPITEPAIAVAPVGTTTVAAETGAGFVAATGIRQTSEFATMHPNYPTMSMSTGVGGPTVASPQRSTPLLTIEHMEVRTDRPEDVADELFRQVEPAAWRAGAWGM